MSASGRWGRCGRGRGVRGAAGRWALLGGALLALVAASVVRVPGGEHRERVHYPHVQPAPLAHLLADFTAHPHGAGPGGSWRVEEERGNYTWWWYRVTFECGGGGGGGGVCAGEARVSALSPAPESPLEPHLVSHRVTLCTPLPLLPWLSSCDELEVESAVSAAAAGGGSVVEERSAARCSALRVLAGTCTRLHDAHRAARRAALAARAHF